MLFLLFNLPFNVIFFFPFLLVNLSIFYFKASIFFLHDQHFHSHLAFHGQTGHLFPPAGGNRSDAPGHPAGAPNSESPIETPGTGDQDIGLSAGTQAPSSELLGAGLGLNIGAGAGHGPKKGPGAGQGP